MLKNTPESSPTPYWKELLNLDSVYSLDEREKVAQRFERDVLQNVRSMAKENWFGRFFNGESGKQVFSTTCGPRQIFREWAYGTHIESHDGSYLVSPTSRPVQLAARELINILQANGTEGLRPEEIAEKNRFLRELQYYYFENKPSEGTPALDGFFVTTLAVSYLDEAASEELPA